MPRARGLVHLAARLASGLVILAFLAIREYLRAAEDHRLSAVGVPFVVIGSTLFVMLPGMEFAALAAAQTAGTDLADIAAGQAALQEWFVPVMVIGGLTFAMALWPLAYHMWRYPVPEAAARPGRAREPHISST